jgi:hypothetical protein
LHTGTRAEVEHDSSGPEVISLLDARRSPHITSPTVRTIAVDEDCDASRERLSTRARTRIARSGTRGATPAKNFFRKNISRHRNSKTPFARVRVQ